jgi:hypothetical protein
MTRSRAAAIVIEPYAIVKPELTDGSANGATQMPMR